MSCSFYLGKKLPVTPIPFFFSRKRTHLITEKSERLTEKTSYRKSPDIFGDGSSSSTPNIPSGRVPPKRPVTLVNRDVWDDLSFVENGWPTPRSVNQIQTTEDLVKSESDWPDCRSKITQSRIGLYQSPPVWLSKNTSIFHEKVVTFRGKIKKWRAVRKE